MVSEPTAARASLSLKGIVAEQREFLQPQRVPVKRGGRGWAVARRDLACAVFKRGGVEAAQQAKAETLRARKTHASASTPRDAATPPHTCARRYDMALRTAERVL